MKTKSIDLQALPGKEAHQLLLSTVAPRPIALASTIDEEGNPNLSPFSYFNVFSSKPPILIFSPARRVRNNTIKHTLINAESTREVVINVVNHAIVQQTSLSSTEYPDGVDEFKKAGLTPLGSEMVRPFRVQESPAQFECRVNEIIPLGQEGGAGNLIICEVVRMHIGEAYLKANGQVDTPALDLVARMGGNWYCRALASALFEVEKPLTTLGMGVDALPAKIRRSSQLSGNDLGRLGNQESLPDEDSLRTFAESDTYQNWRSQYQQEPEWQAVEQQARKFLAQDKGAAALKILLLHL